MRNKLVALAAALAAVAVPLVLAVSASADGPRTLSRNEVRALPGKDSPRARAAAAAAAVPRGSIPYFGGNVMPENTVYTIFWEPTGHTTPAGYKSLVNQFFADVAADSERNTNVYAPSTQFSMATDRVHYQSRFGGTITITDAFPSSGCAEDGGRPCLTETQLVNRIEAVRAAQGWPLGEKTLYFIYTGPGVDSCFDDDSGCSADHSNGTYCAFHGSLNFLDGTPAGSSNMVYAVEPYFAKDNEWCSPGELPHDDAADVAINTSSHEHNEAITDPNIDAWFDPFFGENGDICAWQFGKVTNPGGSGFNQTINGHGYILQLEAKRSGRCVQSGGLKRTKPVIGDWGPKPVTAGNDLTITGDWLGGAAGVRIGQVDVPFTLDDLHTITAHVPPGTVSGRLTVVTAGGKARTRVDVAVG